MLDAQLESLPGWTWNTREASFEEGVLRFEAAMVAGRVEGDLQLRRWIRRQADAVAMGRLAEHRLERLRKAGVLDFASARLSRRTRVHQRRQELTTRSASGLAAAQMQCKLDRKEVCMDDELMDAAERVLFGTIGKMRQEYPMLVPLREFLKAYLASEPALAGRDIPALERTTALRVRVRRRTPSGAVNELRPSSFTMPIGMPCCAREASCMRDSSPRPSTRLRRVTGSPSSLR